MSPFAGGEEKGGQGAQEDLLPGVPLYMPGGQGLQDDVLWLRNIPAWQLQRLLFHTGHMPGGQGRQRETEFPAVLLCLPDGHTVHWDTVDRDEESSGKVGQMLFVKLRGV
jgi:hypothetical protein